MLIAGCLRPILLQKNLVTRKKFGIKFWADIITCQIDIQILKLLTRNHNTTKTSLRSATFLGQDDLILWLCACRFVLLFSAVLPQYYSSILYSLFTALKLLCVPIYARTTTACYIAGRALKDEKSQSTRFFWLRYISLYLNELGERFEDIAYS